MTRQEKKEAQKAMEQALFEEARQAIENKAFTLEADRVIFKEEEMPLFLLIPIL